MTKALATIDHTPTIFDRDGELYTTSRIVADEFGKSHSNVLRDIRNLSCSPQFREINYEFTFENKKIGTSIRDEPTVHMTKDGFAFLAFGYKGVKASMLREAYIARFNEMEAALRTPPTPVFSLNDPASLRTALLGYTEKVLALEAKVAVAEETIAIAAPKAEFFDSFIDADGLYGLQNAARVLDEAPNRFCAWLEVERILFRQGRTLVPHAQYLKMGIFAVKAIVIDEVARQRTYVTPKGLQYLCRRLGKSPDLFGKLR